MNSGISRFNRSFAGNFLVFILLGITAAFMSLPFVYSISMAFKPLDELWLFPPTFFVRNPTFKSFTDLFFLMSNSWVPFSRYLFNTLFITVIGTVGHIFIASMCAYPLAKYTFPGSKLFFSIVVLSLMFNPAVTAIPNYLIMSKVGWVDTYWSLVIPAFGASLGLYLMKQFMEQIPDALLEAAKIDGASEWKSFWIIVMPQVKPAWLTLIIFQVQALWNMGANNFIYSEELKTLPYALSQIASAGIARAGVAAAITVIMMILPITVFVITQSNIIQTMSTSGLKE